MSLPYSQDVSAKAAALAQLGLFIDAYYLLHKAITSGDGLAAFTLAEWRLSGEFIRRDLEEARKLYGVAAMLGVEHADPIHIALLANGAGGSARRWHEALQRVQVNARKDPVSERQADLLAAMAIDEHGDPISPLASTHLSIVPRIEHLPGFLTQAECEYLIERAIPQLRQSVVVHAQSGQFVRDPVRSAFSTAFPFISEDPAIHAINRRIAVATGSDYSQGEPVQVLRYERGDEYKMHSDTLPQGSNQRTTTFLVALNEDYEGGETVFPRVGVCWRGRTGDALRFDNIDAAGNPEAAMWHLGAPVQRGTKYLLSKWIRGHPLDLSGPSGRPL